jgi:hypothetical protein
MLMVEVCGFGPVYCENGCTSHCDAKAECGQFAANPGQKCPLNVCCSPFGKVYIIPSRSEVCVTSNIQSAFADPPTNFVGRAVNLTVVLLNVQEAVVLMSETELLATGKVGT